MPHRPATRIFIASIKRIDMVVSRGKVYLIAAPANTMQTIKNRQAEQGSFTTLFLNNRELLSKYRHPTKMVILLFAAPLLRIGFCQTPHAQTSPKTNSSIRTSPQPHPSVRHNSNQKGANPQGYLLQGAWSDCLDCNAIFMIEGRRVNFFDEIGSDEKAGQTYWKISNNKLSFCYSGGLVVTDTIIKLTKDSLVTYRKDAGMARFVRLK